MKHIISALICFISTAASAAEWTLVNPTTLKMVGPIDADEFAKFQKAMTPAVTRLIVDSGGGEVSAGLPIGRHIRDHKIEVEVQGLCMSSCANYIFTAGSRRIISEGLVGYHGNATAFKNSMTKEEFIQSVISSGGKAEDGETYWNYLTTVLVPEETAFFQDLGISQELFERTQRPDKGMPSGQYSVLLPKPATFEKYGIHNVEGEQSQNMIENDPRVRRYKDAGLPVLLD